MLATMLLGVAISDDWAATGAPATNTAWALTFALPASAVTVFVSAFVDARVVAYTPPPLLLPLAAPNTSAVPLADKATACAGTRLANWSRRVTVTPAVALPSATTVLGDRATVDVAVTAVPATKDTDTCGEALAAVKVMVFASALVERTVEAICPLASVVPVGDENVSLLLLLLVNVPLWLGTVLL